MEINTCLHIYTYMHLPTYIYMHMDMQMHIYTHTYMHESLDLHLFMYPSQNYIKFLSVCKWFNGRPFTGRLKLYKIYGAG